MDIISGSSLAGIFSADCGDVIAGEAISKPGGPRGRRRPRVSTEESEHAEPKGARPAKVVARELGREGGDDAAEAQEGKFLPAEKVQLQRHRAHQGDPRGDRGGGEGGVGKGRSFEG